MDVTFVNLTQFKTFVTNNAVDPDFMYYINDLVLSSYKGARRYVIGDRVILFKYKCWHDEHIDTDIITIEF